jgi:hypothetical protein
MNTLNLIRNGLKKKIRLNQAQFYLSKAYRGIDYTSAHQAPTLDNPAGYKYRGIDYKK